MLDLDNVDALRRLDPGGMLQRIAETPREVGNAWRAAAALELPERFRQATAVAVLGMGGSAIGGDLVRSLVAVQCRVPIQVVREYDLPGYVGAQTLVVASSYSGNTEETLTALREAEGRGAMVLASTSGGTLLEQARRKGYPVYHIQYQAQPRAALAHSFIPLLAILQRLGFVPDYEDQVRDATSVLEAGRAALEEDVPLARNQAKRLAQKLLDRLPVVYGAGIMSEVARRWKGQFNENAKSWSFFEILPELNHNAVLGYQFPESITQRAYVLLLRASALHPRVSLRYDITADILTRFGVEHETIDAAGRTPLAQMLSSIQLSDYLSCYLAFLHGINPSPVEIIDYLKNRLAGA